MRWGADQESWSLELRIREMLRKADVLERAEKHEGGRFNVAIVRQNKIRKLN